VTPLFGINDCLNFWFVVVNKSIDVENAIQVVVFVLKNASEPTLGFKPDWVLI
jgi:hypothetical protein